jgi:acetylornithine deacetylase/succinyl-diaminopimelate desuccinylase-like protein
MDSQMHDTFARQPAALLQKLIQFDTTNPPGNETECITFIQGVLAEAGIETQIIAKSPQRCNLVARLPGQGKSPPLLLYGHADVVTTENQPWTVPPFEGHLVDGYIWGRGALDMKGGLAMMVAAFLRAKQDHLELPGDVVLAIVSDEEVGGNFGAKFLVEEHPDLFKGTRYALGEFGGFSLWIGTQCFYPIMVAEKQICTMKITLRGAGGHGSMPVRGGAMARLGRLLQKLDEQRLPVHITPVARQMIQAIATSLGGMNGLVLGQLTNPAMTDGILNLLGERARIFAPLLHNTVSPTMLQSSQKINVIPNEVSVGLDGRLLPGFRPEDMLQELRQITGDVELEVIMHDPGPAEPNMGFFEPLAGILREADPTGVPIPLLLSGVTDGRFFSRLGIQTYGFLPMQLPADFNFAGTIHSADERIPAAALEFGTMAITKALQRF